MTQKHFERLQKAVWRWWKMTNPTEAEFWKKVEWLYSLKAKMMNEPALPVLTRKAR